MTEYQKPDSSLAASSTADASAPRPAAVGRWRVAAFALGIQLLVLFALYFDTFHSMVHTWLRSETFAHGLAIVPIVLYLVWRRRATLRALPVNPDLWALPFIAGAGALWLAGDLADVQVASQYGATLLIPLSVWVLLGRRVAKALLFPLAFLLLAVPFGEFLVPELMKFTADFTVALLHLTGIPVYREGLHLTLTSGTWSVEAACSGLRYLIASFTLGCLYAYLTYRSLWRRLVFILLSLAVPILANGLRAFTIVLIGHFISMELATGIDHIIYGWLFFGLITFILFWIGGYWRDDESEEGVAESRSVGGVANRGRLFGAAVAAVIAVALWPAYGALVSRIAPSATVALSAPRVSGWTAAPDNIDYTPAYHGTRAHMNVVYRRGNDHAGLYVGMYRNQREHAELIAWENSLTNQGVPKPSDWRKAASGTARLVTEGKPLPVDTAVLGRGDDHILVWRWYWIDGQFTRDPLEVKLRTLYDHLLGRDDAAAAIVVYAPFEIVPDEARETLDGFVGDLLPQLRQSLENVRG